MNLTEYDIDFEHPIGHGQFGSVYRCWSTQRQRWIAIKQVPVNQSPAKIRAEIEGTKNQRKFAQVHKNLIPEVFDDGIAGSAYWIAMELIEGEPLANLILRRSLSAARSVGIAASIADFLRKAHALNLFHSDLKPQHILIGPGDSVTIIDFGIMTEGAASSTSDTNPFASREYASPERLLSGRISRSAEYWSLGVMLYEMLSGGHPYSEVRPNDLERAIVDGHRMAPMPDTVPVDLRAVVQKMLAHRVDARYTEAALAADFDNYLNGRPTAAGEAQRRTGATTIPVPPGRSGSVPRESPATLLVPEPSRTTPARRGASHLRTAAAVAAMWVALGFSASQGAAWARADQLARRIPTMGCADVAGARADYAKTQKWAVPGLGLRWLVNGPLRERMLALAAQPIADYRSDAPPVPEVRWRQAAVCVALAADLSPGNARVESVRKVIEGHLQRIRATTPAEFQAAIGTFQTAAQLDTASADPYLGLARIHAYDMRDVEALANDIRNAEVRGYTPGRRERTQLDDAIKVRTAAAARRPEGVAPSR